MCPVPLPRVGVVVPPENPTAEPELHRLLRSTAAVYTARFPTTPGVALLPMLRRYNEVLPTVLTQFGRLRLDAAVVACSASHYLLGPEGDQRFCAELSTRAGFPVLSPTLALLDAFRAVDVTHLTMVSPYQPWLTETSRGYWEAAGLTVDDVVEVPARTLPADDGDYDPYSVTTDDILTALRAHRGSADGPLLFTGTGMGTLAALDELAGDDPDRVLLSSNLACAWWAERVVGSTQPQGHPLLRRLLDRVA